MDQVVFSPKSLEETLLLLVVLEEMEVEEADGSLDHGFCNPMQFALSADVLMLDAVFIIKSSTKVKLYFT